MEHTKARILHVDDHQDTRLMMAALLQDRGYGIMTAGSVAEALDLAANINFDLFILDVRLPDGIADIEAAVDRLLSTGPRTYATSVC
jgi:CheY-like chemotaxis protein